MSPELSGAPRLLLVVAGLLLAFDLYRFYAEGSTPRALAGALIDVVLIYLVLCGNRLATYIAAAFLAVIAVETLFTYLDDRANWAALTDSILSGLACIYFLSPAMHHFLAKNDAL